MKSFASNLLQLLAAGFLIALAVGQESTPIEVLRVRPNFYMIAGAGGNIGVQVGQDGVVLVDAGDRGSSPQVLSAIEKITNLPIRYVINTGADADHVGGNAALAKAGQTIFTNPLGNLEMARAMTNGGAASIMAHEHVLRRMSAPTGKTSIYPTEAWPTEAFYQNRKTMFFNGEGIEILHMPSAHSDADTMLFFRISDVVATGDILDTTRFPVIDIANGGSAHGVIDALNKIIELTIAPVPFVFQEGGTLVMPGHGRICDQLDVVEYRDMVVITRDVIADMIKRGMTLDQIQVASPAKPYQAQYGTQKGITGAFVEAVYKSLMAKR